MDLLAVVLQRVHAVESWVPKPSCPAPGLDQRRLQVYVQCQCGRQSTFESINIPRGTPSASVHTIVRRWRHITARLASMRWDVGGASESILAAWSAGMLRLIKRKTVHVELIRHAGQLLVKTLFVIFLVNKRAGLKRRMLSFVTTGKGASLFPVKTIPGYLLDQKTNQCSLKTRKEHNNTEDLLFEGRWMDGKGDRVKGRSERLRRTFFAQASLPGE